MTGIINPRKAISLNSVRGSRRTSHPSTRSVYRRGAPEVSIRWSLDREGVRTGPNRSARLRASEPPNSSFPTSRLIWKNTFCSNVRNFFSEINLTNWRNHFFSVRYYHAGYIFCHWRSNQGRSRVYIFHIWTSLVSDTMLGRIGEGEHRGWAARPVVRVNVRANGETSVSPGKRELVNLAGTPDRFIC